MSVEVIGSRLINIEQHGVRGSKPSSASRETKITHQRDGVSQTLTELQNAVIVAGVLALRRRLPKSKENSRQLKALAKAAGLRIDNSIRPKVELELLKDPRVQLDTDKGEPSFWLDRETDLQLLAAQHESLI